MIELLSPAGSIERVKIALLYGADAVYCGGRDYSLRANAKNLSIEEIKEACEYAHKLKKKVYITVNIVFHNEDTLGLVDYLKKLEDACVDAIIVSDPLVIDLVNENKIKLDIHLSTQASSVNYESVRFWQSMGVKRIVLGRETSKNEIKEIIDKTGADIEMFIHGAMCASYSGRCVLSNYLTNRDANRGGCAQICRWNFDLIKDSEKVDSETKFTMASKDLCMLRMIPDIIDTGVCSLKVEGRMRSIYYIATVINTYRRAIDEYYNGSLNEDKIKYYETILNRVANRDSCCQFFLGLPTVSEQYYLGRDEVSNQDFLGMVEEYHDGIVKIRQKNYFKPGDMVEFISPNRDTFSIKIPKIYNEDGCEVENANHPEELITFKLDHEVSEFDMMRSLIK